MLPFTKRVLQARSSPIQIDSRYIVSAGYRSQQKSRRPMPKKREAAYTKQEQYWALMEQNDNWKSMLSKFDADKSGTLDSKELTALIKEFGRGTLKDGELFPPSPTEKEIDWIMRILQHESIGSYSAKAKFALDIWLAYENVHRDLEESFRKFDVDKSGDLDRDELLRLLKHLNDGHPPTVIFYFKFNTCRCEPVINFAYVLFLIECIALQDDEVSLLMSLERNKEDKSWLRLALAVW